MCPLAVLAVLILGRATDVDAHLMPAGKGTFNVVGSKVYVVLSVPARVLLDDRSQMHGGASASLGERDHDDIAGMRARVRQGIELSSRGEVAAFEQILLNPASGEHDGHGDHHHARGGDVVVMIVARFSEPPSTLVLGSDLWAEDSTTLTVEATVSEAGKAVRTEIGELSREQSKRKFFASAGAVAEAGARAKDGWADSIRRGVGWWWAAFERILRSL